MRRALRKITHDAAATIAGAVLAGAGVAADAYLRGAAPSKEAMIAAGVVGVVGYFVKRGNVTPLVKDGER